MPFTREIQKLLHSRKCVDSLNKSPPCGYMGARLSKVSCGTHFSCQKLHRKAQCNTSNRVSCQNLHLERFSAWRCLTLRYFFTDSIYKYEFLSLLYIPAEYLCLCTLCRIILWCYISIRVVILIQPIMAWASWHLTAHKSAQVKQDLSRERLSLNIKSTSSIFYVYKSISIMFLLL